MGCAFLGVKMARSSYLNVNGVDFPSPRYGFQYVYSTAVDAGRNLNNQVVGQKVGRELVKLDQLQWVGLSPADRQKIMKALEPFFVMVTYEDCYTGQPKTVKMYHGDIKVKPLFVDKYTHETTQDEVLSVNLIDCGW